MAFPALRAAILTSSLPSALRCTPKLMAPDDGEEERGRKSEGVEDIEKRSDEEELELGEAEDIEKRTAQRARNQRIGHAGPLKAKR